MNSVPQHLHSEDRQEYERILDEALRSAAHRPELAALVQRLNPEQLRTMALSATAFITTAAAAEYHHYVKVRQELRRPAPSATPLQDAPATETDVAGLGLAAAVGEAAAGAGAGAVVTVLAPVLAGTAAAIFLLVGYVMKMLSPEPAFARTLLTTGWVFGAVTAVAILVAAVGLLLTALRNSATAQRGGAEGDLYEEMLRAREAWHEALLERGLLPFLRDALADPDRAALKGPVPSAPQSRIPHLGYDRPGFSSPEDGTPSGPRPRYSSPDFSSPDFGGPEHQPD
ncbi:hypothetical protein ACFZAO_08180 [Streptomyces griseoaurantiacus]|uniref:hypothetical protein n=1 Tax=Streptomyces griseoaurantiacus TaxID=68213 RepID=UPI0036E08091